jgi:ArsR family transcriptional regulator
MTRSLVDARPAAVDDVADAASCCVSALDVAPALRPEEAAGHAAVLKALADPHRLRMLSLIAAQPASDPLCVCEIEGEFGLSQPTVSHHLKVLREAGLVTVTKRGLWHHYAPRPEGLRPLQELLTALAPTAGASAD